MERAAAAFLIVFPGVATLPGTGRADSTAVTQATTAVPNSPANAPDPPPAGLLAPIAVIAKRPPIAELTPLQHISANEIRVSGASNLADLLQTLAPQLGANVDVGSLNLLLNGRPTAGGLLELQDIPPEAIQSIDLLPPEAALQFGYSPDNISGPVVNFVLYPRFVATTVKPPPAS
jgi:iron complex outermembrane receptor protein